nr:hypothetical protein [Morchella crassipes]
MNLGLAPPRARRGGGGCTHRVQEGCSAADDLKSAFPELIPVARPLIQNKKKKIKDPNWLAGFVSGEGNFFINIINSKTKVGRQVVLMFSISQHSRDADLLRDFCDFFDCGSYYPRSNRNEGNFTITKFSDIELKIIPCPALFIFIFF